MNPPVLVLESLQPKVTSSIFKVMPTQRKIQKDRGTCIFYSSPFILLTGLVTNLLHDDEYTISTKLKTRSPDTISCLFANCNFFVTNYLQAEEFQTAMRNGLIREEKHNALRSQFKNYELWPSVALYVFPCNPFSFRRLQ